MDFKKALAAFKSLEQQRWPNEPTIPVYDVRLDAVSAKDTADRVYRIRVTPAVGGIGTLELQKVLSVARGADLQATLRNTGIELA